MKLGDGKCTGCGLCAALCPKHAISLQKNPADSSLVARIDERKCVDCGKCVKICPEIAPPVFNTPQRCYAGWMKANKPTECTSGGIAYALMEVFLKVPNTAVCGAVWHHGKCEHILTSNTEEIVQFCGSKYVQSDLDGVIPAIHEAIEAGMNVMFVGTPCQVAAIKKCIPSHKAGSLFCIDLVCHGVPPTSFLDSYLQKEFQCPTITSCRMRDALGYAMLLEGNNNKGRILQKRIPFQRNLYLLAFLKNLSLRENCYRCSYAKSERVGDITIGDFWGLDRTSLPLCPKHPSMIFVNTVKGVSFFQDLIDNGIVEAYQQDVAQAVKGNTQLQHPTIAHPDRPKFLEHYHRTGCFSSAVMRTELSREYQGRLARIYGASLAILRRLFPKKRQNTTKS